MADSLRAVLENIIYPWPVRCAACGGRNRARSILCDTCREGRANARPLVNFASAPGIDSSAAAYMYTRQAAAMVRSLKYRALRALAREMAEDMLEAARFAGFTAPDEVVYVPMHWTRRRNRFYNQSRILAQLVARAMGAEMVDGIRRVRPCRQQAAIHDDEARRANVRDAFRAKLDFTGKSVVLIDDVYTTGATAGECAMALKRAGADRVMLLTYATAHKSHTP